MTTDYSYKTDLFEERKWQGEFFLPDQFEQRFWGEIEYSPEHGVIFTYSIIGSETPPETAIVHGILNTGERCSLIGRFRPVMAGIRLHHGQSTRFGKSGFKLLLIGFFVEENEKFQELSFSLMPMQEFFFPNGRKDLEKYTDTPLVSIDTSYGKLEIGNNAKFAHLYSADITTQIYSPNKKALEELKVAFNHISEKYENAHFMLKHDIAYGITLKINDGAGILDAYNHISDIANLFALLIYSPVYPDSIHIIKKYDELPYQISIRVYPSMVIDKKTIEICKAELSHYNLPIRRSNIDLSSLIDTWLEAPTDYATIITSLQHETGYRTEHSAHGELVLYTTQFEYISHKEGKKDKKYEYPLANYASDKLRNIITKIFNDVGETDIGIGISNLRNEIAHIGRPVNLLLSLSLKELIAISRIMQLTIIGYILENIGISKNLVSSYQDTNFNYA